MTKYFLMIIFVMGVLLAGSGYLLKESYEKNGKLSIALEHQKAETVKAIQEIENIKAQHALQIDLMNAHLSKEREDNARYAKQIRSLQQTAKTSKAAALKEPERYGRIATYSGRRGMRNVCRASGGSPKTCKIKIPKSAKTVSSPALQPNPENNDRVGVPSIDRGNPTK